MDSMNSSLKGWMFFPDQPGVSLLILVILLMAGLYMMRLLGFRIAAPLLVMVLMLMVGERRPLWLFTGVVMVPLGIWSSIELLLKRPLP